MIGFINRIINRHADPQNVVVPRLPGKFEGTRHFDQDHSMKGINDLNFAADSPDTLSQDHNNSFVDSIQHNKNLSSINKGKSEKRIDKNNAIAINTNFSNVQMPDKSEPTLEKNLDELSGDQNKISIQVEKAISGPLRVSNNNIFENNLKSQGNINFIQKNTTDKKSTAIPVGSVTLINSNPKNKKDAIQSITPLQIQRPVSALSSKQQHSKVLTPFDLNKENQQPVIKVHIGRIEIKAVNQQPQTAVNQKSNNTHKLKMSLDDYLNKRNAGQ